MPAQTIIEIEKVYQGEFWVNRYFCSEAIGAADNTANAILAVERSIHLDLVTFTKMSLRTVAPLDYIYATAPLNLPGLLSGGDPLLSLPLFVVLRVDMGAQVGRPSRKYYRGCLYESVVSINALQTAFVNNTNALVAPLATIAGHCDVDGDEIISATVMPIPAMRQLRRGSKKKVIP